MIVKGAVVVTFCDVIESEADVAGRTVGRPAVSTGPVATVWRTVVRRLTLQVPVVVKVPPDMPLPQVTLVTVPVPEPDEI